MSKESQDIFKLQLQYLKQQTNKKLKVKKPSVWLHPSAFTRQYSKLLKTIMDKYINVTLSLFPLLENWQKEIKQINDQWEEELNTINENEFDKIFIEEKEFFKKTLLTTGVLISIFNRKQWQKIIKQAIGIDFFTYENWENTFLNTWVTNNVNLIKGLTEEYRKKIVNTIIDNFSRNIALEDLKTNLKNINKTFSNYRINLIAKDQVNKLNAQLSEQRQKDAGIEIYIWNTARDERVRPKHAAMQGKLCRWDNATVYSDDGGKTWKSRSSIGGINLHPGEDVNCRCFAEPYFGSVIEEINNI